MAHEIEESLMKCQEIIRFQIPELKDSLNLDFQCGFNFRSSREIISSKLLDPAIAGRKSEL
jgi:hypothetical protein